MASISNPEPNLLTLEGEIDLHESSNVRQKLNPLIERKLPEILVDLSGVSYIDSSGLALFIDAMQRIQAYGGKLSLFGIRKNVLNIFQIARLDQIFRIFPDKSAAVSSS